MHFLTDSLSFSQSHLNTISLFILYSFFFLFLTTTHLPIFFCSIADYYNSQKHLKCEQFTLQCSLLVEKHGSNSNLKNGDGEAVGVGFWGVFSLKLALKNPLEMLLYW